MLDLHDRALLIFGTGAFFVVESERYTVRCLAASPGLYLQDTNNAPPAVMTQNTSRHCECLLGVKSHPAENHRLSCGSWGAMGCPRAEGRRREEKSRSRPGQYSLGWDACLIPVEDGPPALAVRGLAPSQKGQGFLCGLAVRQQVYCQGLEHMDRKVEAALQMY